MFAVVRVHVCTRGSADIHQPTFVNGHSSADGVSGSANRTHLSMRGYSSELRACAVMSVRGFVRLSAHLFPDLLNLRRETRIDIFCTRHVENSVAVTTLFAYLAGTGFKSSGCC